MNRETWDYNAHDPQSGAAFLPAHCLCQRHNGPCDRPAGPDATWQACSDCAAFCDPPARRPCGCGSGLESRELLDARCIYCGRVCDRCEAEKRAEFRPDIFTDPDYWTDEPVDDD